MFGCLVGCEVGWEAAGGPNDSCVGQTGRPTPVMVMGTVSVKVAGPLLHRCSVATPAQRTRDPASCSIPLRMGNSVKFIAVVGRS